MKITSKITAGVLFALSCLCSGIAVAQDTPDAEKQLRAALAEMAPNLPVTSITESVLPGVYEVVSNSQVYYLSPNGRYLVEGSIIDLKDQVNISDKRRGGLQLSLIAEMPEEQMLVFNNEENNAERWITVFTDTDCGYCQRLHQEIDLITAADIKVRYLLFPRAGIDSDSSAELQSVWCAEDQQAAMTTAKSGGSVDPASCENPIQAHMDLARQVELRGTPLIYLDDGTKIPGYRPANELISMIESSEPLAVEQ